MNIALIGYGKMGKAIEKIAKERGHVITAKLDVSNKNELHSKEFLNSDVAIEFTRPESALDNILHCCRSKVPVVVGTTGWLDHIDTVKAECKLNDSAVFFASNYSIGMNITFALNEKLAEWMNELSEYDVNIDETHHIHKLDEPSGTAISLAESVINGLDRKTHWKNEESKDTNALNIISHREGEVPGTHCVEYKSDIDRLIIKHEAFNRTGFALGAVKVAEWIPGKKGILKMNDFLNI